MSSLEEIRAAAIAAARVDLPYTFTASFDTAGRTMLGVTPAALVEFAESLTPRPVAIGGLSPPEHALVLCNAAFMPRCGNPGRNRECRRGRGST